MLLNEKKVDKATAKAGDKVVKFDLNDGATGATIKAPSIQKNIPRGSVAVVPQPRASFAGAPQPRASVAGDMS